VLKQEPSILDIESIRARFPALERRHGDRPVIFFDNPAGTQVPSETIDGFRRYFEHSNANVGGTFATSEETDRLIAAARQGMAAFLGAGSPQEIAFGPNMTSLTFQVSHALSSILQPGDEIVTTRLEHDANVAPWLALERRGAVIRWIDVNPDDMTLNLESAEQVIGPRTRLVAVGLASNAFGTVNDVRSVAELAHGVNAWVFVDAVHYGPHGPIDVEALGVDLLACSPYKFFGPHLGVLWGRREVLEVLPVAHVRPAGDVAPEKWETGTKSHEAVSGLLGTLDYLASLAESGKALHETLRTAMDAINAYERTLSKRLISGISSIRRVRLFGITSESEFEHRVPTISFLVEGTDPAIIARRLGEEGIFSWAGTHYAVEPMRVLGLPATQRIGLVHYNTYQEIDRFLETLESLLP
jgi:cysteine desulfurase family protein (TIGR01976 family)